MVLLSVKYIQPVATEACDALQIVAALQVVTHLPLALHNEAGVDWFTFDSFLLFPAILHLKYGHKHLSLLVSVHYTQENTYFSRVLLNTHILMVSFKCTCITKECVS